MKPVAVVVVLGLLACGSHAKLRPNVTLLPCKSPEAEAAALATLDFINGQHTHGYKYALNQIEDFQLLTQADGSETYLMEVELLETKCHILDPTDVSLCPVRTKIETAIEADCDAALSKANGQFSIVAFKCKTEKEAFRICGGCPFLRPLNDTDGTQLIQDSLNHFNKNHTLKAAFTLLEVGRLSSQVVGGGPKFRAEYAIIETNCTNSDDSNCVPLHHTVARHGFCRSEGVADILNVNCDVFVPPEPPVDPVTNATLPLPPPVVLHAHTAGPEYTPKIHSITHHKLTALHDPAGTGLLSAESAESAEAAPIVKREVVAEVPAEPLSVGQQFLFPRCPGKIRHF